MTTKILHLPANSCQYWDRHHCLYEKYLNPGLESFACTTLLKLKEHFDDFVNRGECFGLSDERMSAIWYKRLSESATWRERCPQGLVLLDATGDPTCPNFQNDACLLRLPRCLGRCRRYIYK